MSSIRLNRIAHVAAQFMIGLTFSSPVVADQSVKIEGIINSRNADTMIVKTSDSPRVTILLTDDTQVGQVQGVLKAE